MTRLAFFVLESCARNSGGELICNRFSLPNSNMVVGSRVTTDRGKRFEKGFGSRSGGSADVQKKNARGSGPATERCGTRQVKAKMKTRNRHVRDGMTATV